MVGDGSGDVGSGDVGAGDVGAGDGVTFNVTTGVGATGVCVGAGVAACVCCWLNVAADQQQGGHY